MAFLSFSPGLWLWTPIYQGGQTTVVGLEHAGRALAPSMPQLGRQQMQRTRTRRLIK